MEQVGYGNDEVEEGESKEKTKSSTKLTDQRVRWEDQHLERESMRWGRSISTDKRFHSQKGVITLVEGYIALQAPIWVHARFIGRMGYIEVDALYISKLC